MKFALVLLISSLALGHLGAAEKTLSLTDGGIAEFEAGHLDAAITKFTAALEKEPKNASALNNRALAYRQKKDYAHAIADFTAALGLKKEWFVYYNRGIAFQENGDTDAAIGDFSAALKTAPKKMPVRTDCFLARAHAYFNKEDADLAMADLNAAIKLGVKDPDAYVLRGLLHKIHHRYAPGLADYEKAVALDPKDARSYNVEAYLLSVCPAPKFRDGRKAISYATKACELSNWKAADYIETLAAAYAENRQFEEAISWQKKATQLAPTAVDKQRLALYQQKKPLRELNRKEQAIPGVSDLPNRVSIKIGQKLTVQFEERGDELIAPSPADGVHRRPRSLLLNFSLQKKERTLRIEHTFWRTLQGRCLARLAGYDTYFETDILPVKVSTISPELWSEPIEELVLFDLKLTGPSSEPTSPEEESAVASVAAATVSRSR